jgi:hypothetical protein
VAARLEIEEFRMPLAMTDAIPLMEPDGVTPRNNARDIRTQLLASLLLPDAIGPGVRPGILPRSYVGLTTNQYVDLKVLALGSPDSAVQMYPGRCVVHRTGQGPYILMQETTVSNYDLDDANVTNPRIDVIFARLYDHAIGDSSGGPHGPYIDHVNGIASGSPAVPAIPTDAIPIAQILRPANTNAVTSGNITDLRKSTSLNGAPRPLLPGDSLSDPGLFVSERRLRMATAAQIAANTAVPYIEEIWCADGKWKPTVNAVIARNRRTSLITTTATTAATATRIFNTAGQVLAGRTYKISGRGVVRGTAASSVAEIHLRYTTNGTEPLVTSADLLGVWTRAEGSGVPETVEWSVEYPATSDHELRVMAAIHVAIGGGTVTFDCSAANPGELKIKDTGPTIPLSGIVYSP